MAVQEMGPEGKERSRSGPLLVFVHGRLGDGNVWNPLTRVLSSEIRCLRVDLPGHGRSFIVRDRGFSLLEHVRLIQELVSRFSNPDGALILIGHDTGGAIAQVCTLAGGGVGAKIVGLILLNSASLCRQLSSQLLPTGWVRWKLKGVFDGSPALKPEYQEALGAPWCRKVSRTCLLRSIEAMDRSWPWPYERQVWLRSLRKIRQPVLLLWGKNDPLNPLEMGEDLARQIPGAELLIHEQAGHWPNLEQPEWVLAKTKEFLVRNFDLREAEVS